MKILKWIKSIFFDDYKELRKEWEAEFERASALTTEELHSNMMLDFRIEQAERRNNIKEDANNAKIKAWKEGSQERDRLRKENPDKVYYESCPDLDVTTPEQNTTMNMLPL